MQGRGLDVYPKLRDKQAHAASVSLVRFSVAETQLRVRAGDSGERHLKQTWPTESVHTRPLRVALELA